jgi:chromosome segregation ATPase
MALSTKTIVEVANALSQEGIVPTNALVRSRLGSGSYTTINAGLKLWRTKQNEQRQAGMHDFELTLEKIVNVSAITNAAKEFARKEFAGEQKLLHGQLLTLEKELHQTSRQIDDLEDLVNFEKNKNIEFEQEIKKQGKEIAVLEERCDSIAAHERAMAHRLDMAISAKADVERKAIHYEEKTKILQEQLLTTKAELEDFVFADEKAKRTEEVMSRFIYRTQQVVKIIDQLKHGAKDKAEQSSIIEKVNSELQALVDKCKPDR